MKIIMANVVTGNVTTAYDKEYELQHSKPLIKGNYSRFRIIG